MLIIRSNDICFRKKETELRLKFFNFFLFLDDTAYKSANLGVAEN